MAKGTAGDRRDVLQGTLDLMVLKTLETLGPQHGYGIARRIEQMSEDVLKLNEGTVYAAITRSGRRQLARETENWSRIAGVMARLLGTAERS